MVEEAHVPQVLLEVSSAEGRPEVVMLLDGT